MDRRNELIQDFIKSRWRINAPQKSTSSKFERENPFETTFESMSEIAAAPTVWLWRDVVASGRVVLLTGAAAVGKSYVALDIVTAASRGKNVPGFQPHQDEVDGVLMITPEYEMANGVRPKLERMGADLDNIYAIRGVHRRDRPSTTSWQFQLNKDLELLEEDVALFLNTKPPMQLIVIDPFPVALFEGHQGRTELIRTMQHLAAIAAWSGAGIIVVTDAISSARSNPLSLARIIESTVQSAWTIVEDPEDSQRKLLLPIKSNLTQNPLGLSFQIDDGIVEWASEPVCLTAEQFHANSAARSRFPLFEQDCSELARAIEWLQHRLKAGVVPLQTIKQESEANDISYTTLRRAFCGLRGLTRRIGSTRKWEWSLPQLSVSQPQMSPSEQLTGSEFLAELPDRGDEYVNQAPEATEAGLASA